MITIKFKLYKIVLIFLFTILNTSNITFSQIVTLDSVNNLKRCKVTRIKDIGNAYTIGLECDCFGFVLGTGSAKGKWKYTIISKKSNQQKNQLTIKKGDYYDLLLYPIDDYPLLIGDFKKITLNIVIDDGSEKYTVRFINKKYYHLIQFVLSPCIDGLYYKGCDW